MKQITLTIVLSLLCLRSIAADGEPIVPLGQGFELHQVVESKDLHSFAWDGHGSLWTLRGKGNRLYVEKIGAPVLIHSFRRQGDHRSGLLVNDGKIFVSDAGAIRVFQQKGNRFVENPSLVLPRDFFPKKTLISTLRWSPLGHIHFAFQSGPGIGRFDPRLNQWDILTKGIDGGEFSFDQDGLMIASDTSSDHVFRIATGLDYANGLENYTKADVALRLDRTGLKPVALATYTGDQWPEENRTTWLLYNRQTSSLQQYREETNKLSYWRDLAVWKNHIPVSQLQIGPDGSLWFIAADSILRLESTRKNCSASPPDLATLSTSEVAAHLANSNSWHRDIALRILELREDLRAARGLHPSTVLGKIYGEKTNAPLTRVHALWALHRVNLLDEGPLEESADDPSPLLRAWTARLFGERKYPTGQAFERLEKMARNTNSTVAIRMAVAVAARQYVSGSFLHDTPPPTIPIREVFTGGILSSLWFSTERGSTPEFDLLYWNAVKPISAFDAAHPLGFFQGDREEKMPIAYWIITRIAKQVAETDDPLKQEDALLMLTKLKPANHRMLACALEGLKAGSPNRKEIPTEQSFDTLRQFAKSEHQNVATLAREILDSWSKPLPK